MIDTTGQGNKLYDNVLAVTADYLGPAAERFVDRQIISHLKKSPQELVKKDMEKLIEWCRVSMALLTDDQRIVNKYAESMSRVGESQT